MASFSGVAGAPISGFSVDPSAAFLPRSTQLDLAVSGYSAAVSATSLIAGYMVSVTEYKRDTIFFFNIRRVLHCSDSAPPPLLKKHCSPKRASVPAPRPTL